jgi:DEAD/DEAH box helicase domain-containing protein
MLNFAEMVFGVKFDEHAIITEDRLSPTEFFQNIAPEHFTAPTLEQIEELAKLADLDERELYLFLAYESWFPDSFKGSDIDSPEFRLSLSEKLIRHVFFQKFLFYSGDSWRQISDIAGALSSLYPTLKGEKPWETLVESLLALVSHARTGTPDNLRPFLTVRAELWGRELRRLVAKVASAGEVVFSLTSNLNEEKAFQYLPVVNCRECGETGWVSILSERNSIKITDYSYFYDKYFDAYSRIRMMFPYDGQKETSQMDVARICPECLRFDYEVGPNSDPSCRACGSTETIRVLVPKLSVQDKAKNKQYVCPFCKSEDSIVLTGVRSPTAISSVLSQIFASRFNDDKKTLTFSDSVQDAAHRAGFVNSRSWRFGLRGSIQRYLQDEGEDLSLEDFREGFVNHYRKIWSPEKFVSYFIAPNMTWLRTYENMIKEGKLDDFSFEEYLFNLIKKRLKYEILLEYGLNSSLGRSLDKSLSSVIAYPSEDIIRVADNARERVINELNLCQDSTIESFRHMVIGFLYVMRASGAFNDDVYSNISKTPNFNDVYYPNRKWFPGPLYGHSKPRFICHESSLSLPSIFDHAAGGKYSGIVAASLGDFDLNREKYGDIAEIIFRELSSSGVLKSFPNESHYELWGLNQEKLKVTSNVSRLVCDHCGSRISSATENAALWVGSPCRRFKCQGRYRLDKSATKGYYGRIYGEGDIFRIIAKEHTGLLNRDARKEIETSFKREGEERKPWDVNTLSCTPTLELGIDVGDLSSVILCNVPPSQSEYFQRVGRAGRKDGNAFAMTIANAIHRDLYFYADPLDMIRGKISPPFLFLQASAVLERQFTAYSFDTWVKLGGNPGPLSLGAIPPKVGGCLADLDNQESKRFPNNFYLFVKQNLTDLLQGFFNLFDKIDSNGLSELNIDTKNALISFATGDGEKRSPMSVKIYDSFKGVLGQINSLSSVITELKAMITDLKKKPKDASFDEEIKKLKMEQTAIAALIRELRKKEVFNFLSDEGILPNYAFPEAGVILKAVLRRDEKEKEDDSGDKVKYPKMVYEYNRSASSALSEFAPDNTFYADGRKLNIDQIDVQTSQSEYWRLCPNCSHAQLEVTGQDTHSCPRCGSPAWADFGQVRKMLKVRMVYSNGEIGKNLISDDSDDRRTVFYSRKLMADIDEKKGVKPVYVIPNPDFTFGLDYIEKAVLREINFGERNAGGEKITIAGLEEQRKGFRICKYCGKIQINDKPPQHTYVCPARNLSADNPFEECLFLYREFQTEVLRLLIPATTMDNAKTRTESFAALINLGLKEQFGNVSHLNSYVSEVPVRDHDYRKQYLMIYDSIPGGTGYLKQIAGKPQTLFEILEKALSVLEDCSCASDPNKDGCYHCLFAYRQKNRNIGFISRKMAISLAKSILSGKIVVDKDVKSVADIPSDSLCESELESNFIAALPLLSSSAGPIKVNKTFINGKACFRLKIGSVVWEVEPQVTLDENYGVQPGTRADFVLWPRRGLDKRSPVAIYLDGFHFHKFKVEDDTLKREAVRRSGLFKVFTLSYKDVQSVFEPQGDYISPSLSEDLMPSGNFMYVPIVQAGKAENLKPGKLSPMRLLLRYLESPNSESLFQTHAKAYSFSLLNNAPVQEDLFNKWLTGSKTVASAFDLPWPDFPRSDTMCGIFSPSTVDSNLQILAGSNPRDPRNVSRDVSVFAILNDVPEERTEKFEADWNGFWHFFNLMQFSKSFLAATKVGLSKSGYYGILAPPEEIIPESDQEFIDSGVSDDWKEIFPDLYGDEAKTAARRLMAAGFPAPSSVGYELIGPGSSVVAQAEMVWELQRVAWLLPEQEIYKEAFIAANFTVFCGESDIDPSIFSRK